MARIIGGIGTSHVPTPAVEKVSRLPLWALIRSRSEFAPLDECTANRPGVDPVFDTGTRSFNRSNPGFLYRLGLMEMAAVCTSSV